MKHRFKTLKHKELDSIKYQRAINSSTRNDVIALSIADSDYRSAPKVIQALKKRVNHGAFGYLGTQKDVSQLIVSWYQRRYKTTIEPDWVIFTPTVLNTIAMVINEFTEKNDQVLIQTPVYHVFKPAIESNERISIENPLRKTALGYEIDFEDLETKLKNGVKMFLLCSPHNPVGRVFTQEELHRMIALCKQYHVLVVCDEIHADLIMPGHGFTSTASYYKLYEKIIAISAPGKSFNVAGMHIAYMIISSEDLRKKITHTYNKLHIGHPNLLAWKMLEAAYSQSDDWVDAQNKHIWKNFQLLKEFVSKIHKDAWIAPLEGTYLAWVNIEFSGLSSTIFTEKLTRYGVVVSEGTPFGNDGINYIRINIACSYKQLKTALKRINNFLNNEIFTS